MHTLYKLLAVVSIIAVYFIMMTEIGTFMIITKAVPYYLGFTLIYGGFFVGMALHYADKKD